MQRLGIAGVDGDIPARWIGRLGVRTRPRSGGGDGEITRRQRPGAAIWLNQRATEQGIISAILQTNVAEHQLAIVIQLQTEPVPALSARRERAGAELVIHPRRPADIERLSLNR